MFIFDLKLDRCTLLKQINVNNHEAFAAFSDNARYVAYYEQDGIVIRDLEKSFKKKIVVKGVLDIKFSAEGKCLIMITKSENGNLYLYFCNFEAETKKREGLRAGFLENRDFLQLLAEGILVFETHEPDTGKIINIMAIDLPNKNTAVLFESSDMSKIIGRHPSNISFEMNLDGSLLLGYEQENEQMHVINPREKKLIATISLRSREGLGEVRDWMVSPDNRSFIMLFENGDLLFEPLIPKA